MKQGKESRLNPLSFSFHGAMKRPLKRKVFIKVLPEEISIAEIIK
ncbi:hypothetical protein [Lacrimispora brassicae]